MPRLESGGPSSAPPSVVTTADVFAQIDDALLGVSRFLANDLGMPSLELLQARANLVQLRELVRLLERAA